MSQYDLIVIGSGPAGQRAAIQGAKCGKRVAVIEQREVVGGVCINTGTIPSKTMREAVLHLSGYNYQNIYGVSYRVKEKITMADLAFRVQHVIKTEVDVTQAQLARNGIEVLTGIASFKDPKTLQITSSRGSTEVSADIIVIAVGTKPASSEKVPINARTIINSDQILDMPSIPRTLIVVGGGVIGVEYTCMFATLGVGVTLIEKRPRLLEVADSEIVEALNQSDADPESRKHARVLDADHPAPNDNQRARNGRHVQNLVAVDDRARVDRNFFGRGGFRTHGDHNNICAYLGRSARRGNLQCFWVLEAGNASQHFDSVASQLRLRNVDFGFDNMLHAKSKIGHRDLLFYAITYTVYVLIVVAGQMQNGFAHRLARNRTRINTDAADYFSPFDKGNAFSA